MQGQGRVAGIIYGLLAAIIWGGFPVITRLGVAHSSLDAFDVTFLRFAVSGTFLLPVIVKHGLGDLGLKPIALMVLGIGAPYMLLIALGLRVAPASLFAVLTPGSMIVFSAVLGFSVLNERPSTVQIAGIALIIAGLFTGLSDLLRLPGLVEGGAFSVLAGGLWATYTMTTKAYKVAALRATALVSVTSALAYCPIYLLVKGLVLLQAPIAEIATQAVYQGLLMSFLALYFFSACVSILGPSVGASFAALVPGMSIVQAATLLGERPTPLSLTGLVVVTVGMALNLFRR